jgi:DNA-binding GntR family transcriptional regulator
MRKEKMGVDEWDEEELREEPPPLELMLLREAPTRLIRQSLSQQAGEAIKRRILSLDLPPGTRLVVDVLAEEMGVSRTPVREALRELVSQGLVTYDGNSYTVTRYTRRDVEEIFAIRRALEVLAARQAAERISPQALQELRALCEEGVRRLRERDAKFLVEMDSRFHEIIAEQSGNTRLQSMLASLRDQAWLIRNRHRGRTPGHPGAAGSARSGWGRGADGRTPLARRTAHAGVVGAVKPAGTGTYAGIHHALFRTRGSHDHHRSC